MYHWMCRQHPLSRSPKLASCDGSHVSSRSTAEAHRREAASRRDERHGPKAYCCCDQGSRARLNLRFVWKWLLDAHMLCIYVQNCPPVPVRGDTSDRCDMPTLTPFGNEHATYNTRDLDVQTAPCRPTLRYLRICLTSRCTTSIPEYMPAGEHVESPGITSMGQ